MAATPTCFQKKKKMWRSKFSWQLTLGVHDSVDRLSRHYCLRPEEGSGEVTELLYKVHHCRPVFCFS